MELHATTKTTTITNKKTLCECEKGGKTLIFCYLTLNYIFNNNVLNKLMNTNEYGQSFTVLESTQMLVASCHTVLYMQTNNLF